MRRLPKWLKGIFILIAIYFLFFFRLPLYLEVPGNVFSLDEMIELDQKHANTPGDFYITTVGIQQLTPAMIGRSLFPYQDLVKESELFGESDDFESYNRIQRYHMESSINRAIKSAFDAAGENYEFKYKGVHVLQISKDSNFKGKLNIGDSVQAVNGNYFKNSREFIDYIGNQNAGDEITLKVERDDQMMYLTGKLVDLETGKAGIGIGLVDHTEIITDPVVRIQSRNIGGPSAGLMFSLEVYNQLVAQNIRGDYNIAGTGTIDFDGKVGRIGGIEKKVLAADRENIDYFFAPDDELTSEYLSLYPEEQSNYEAAKETVKDIESDMVVVPVKSIMDAINYLKELQLKETVLNKNNLGHLYDCQRKFRESMWVA